MAESLEIDAEAFERELRGAVELTVLDTRRAEDFGRWHVRPLRGRVVNLPEAELTLDRRLARALAADGSPLRVICYAGNSSRRVTAGLRRLGIEALSVLGGMAAWSRVLQRAELPLAGPFTVVQFRREARGCLSYLVCAGEEALVVDPGPRVEDYLDEAATRGARIVRVFDTHIHADHLSGARELAERSGGRLTLARASLSRGVRYAERVSPVEDGELLSLGDAPVRVIGLPGHTSDMTGLQLGEVALIGGDALFADSVARPDLESGDTGAAAAARQLFRTLHGRIGSLPPALELLPCHYAAAGSTALIASGSTPPGRRSRSSGSTRTRSSSAFSARCLPAPRTSSRSSASTSASSPLRTPARSRSGRTTAPRRPSGPTPTQPEPRVGNSRLEQAQPAEDDLSLP